MALSESSYIMTSSESNCIMTSRNLDA